MVPQTGNYTFFLSSDDGSLLYLDGILSVHNDPSNPFVTVSNTMFLNGGNIQFKDLNLRTS